MDKASGDGVRPAGNQIIKPELEDSRSSLVATSKTATAHNFTVSVNEEKTSFSYSHFDQISVGFSVSTEYLVGLFK